MDCVTQKQIENIRNLRSSIYDFNLQHQKEIIRQHSPYSNKITPHIKQHNELRLYVSLRLQESYITRPAIIRPIDFDLWVSSEKCSNFELMQKGCAPYEFDAPEGKIELHHIGQDFNAPFAELTEEEHTENGKLLHSSNLPSWRQGPSFEREFDAERIDYWKIRAKKNYAISEFQAETFPAYSFQPHQEYLLEIRKTCETLYGQCEAEDLDYLSDLAKSYAMMQRIGTNSLNDFLEKTREEQNSEIACTACGSVKYVLHGTYQTTNEKIQRYKCLSCGKVFSLFQRSLISGSAFSFREWIKFIDCLYNGYTIKQTAAACDISEQAAHENRIKLFYALKILNDEVLLRGRIVLDETYIPLSYKGNHSKQEDFVMPREAHERGGENHKKGLSKNLVAVVCALDEFGNSVAKVAGTGTPSGLKLKYALQPHFSEEISCLYSDKSTGIRKFAELCGYQIKQEKLSYKNKKKSTRSTRNKDAFVVIRYLQVMGSYHARLKRFLNRFSGISTKYLSGYLYLFAWKERSKDLAAEDVYKELLQIMTTPNNYLSAEEIMKDSHFPDAKCIDRQYLMRESRNLDRDREIYRRYAAGETMKSIGMDLGLSARHIGYIIKQVRKKGMGYQTQRELQRNQKKHIRKNRLLNEKHQRIVARNVQIFQEKQEWTGTPDEFNKATSCKYGLSVSRVKNIVSEMKRIQKLMKEIFVYEDVSYSSSKEVYQAIHAEWLEIRQQKPETPQMSIEATLADKYGFSSNHIRWIVGIMTNDPEGDYFSKKRKLTTVETFKRDKALFIDYLRWEGTKKAFCTFAAQKYNLSECYVYTIIEYCLWADPKRLDMA